MGLNRYLKGGREVCERFGGEIHTKVAWGSESKRGLRGENKLIIRVFEFGRFKNFMGQPLR